MIGLISYSDSNVNWADTLTFGENSEGVDLYLGQLGEIIGQSGQPQ